MRSLDIAQVSRLEPKPDSVLHGAGCSLGAAGPSPNSELHARIGKTKPVAPQCFHGVYLPGEPSLHPRREAILDVTLPGFGVEHSMLHQLHGSFAAPLFPTIHVSLEIKSRRQSLDSMFRFIFSAGHSLRIHASAVHTAKR